MSHHTKKPKEDRQEVINKQVNQQDKALLTLIKTEGQLDTLDNTLPECPDEQKELELIAESVQLDFTLDTDHLNLKSKFPSETIDLTSNHLIRDFLVLMFITFLTVAVGMFLEGKLS